MEAEWSRPDAAEQLGQGVFLSVPEPVERSKGSETAEGTCCMEFLLNGLVLDLHGDQRLVGLLEQHLDGGRGVEDVRRVQPRTDRGLQKRIAFRPAGESGRSRRVAGPIGSGLPLAGPQSHGYRLGESIDLSVEGERTTQAGAAAQQVALYRPPGVVSPSPELDPPP